MSNKFELLADQSIMAFGVTLFRIRARISFGNVSAGDLGGFVQRDENLSDDGNAWVSGDAWVVWFTSVGSENGTLTAFRAKTGIEVTRGCFHGSLDEFAAAVDEQHGNSQVGAEYRLLIQFIRLRLGEVDEKSEAA